MLQISQSTAQFIGLHSTQVPAVSLLGQLRVRCIQLGRLRSEVRQIIRYFVEGLAAFYWAFDELFVSVDVIGSLTSKQNTFPIIVRKIIDLYSFKSLIDIRISA